MSHIHINFEHVNYSYEKSVPILQDITFTAHENDSIRSEEHTSELQSH